MDASGRFFLRAEKIIYLIAQIAKSFEKVDGERRREEGEKAIAATFFERALCLVIWPINRMPFSSPSHKTLYENGPNRTFYIPSSEQACNRPKRDSRRRGGI